METGIIIAIISAAASVFVGLLSFVGVVVTNRKANKELIHKMEVQQAVTDTKIDELTREVREHNNFAKRMPTVEKEIEHIDKEINHIDKEIDRLRAYHERG